MLNPPSVSNVLGATLPCLLFLGGLVAMGLRNPAETLQAPLFVWLIYALMVLPAAALLAHILFSAGQSVTLLEDGLRIEPWISSLFRPEQVVRVRWYEIRQAGYTATHLPGYTLETLSLTTLRGRFVFRTVCFDPVELRYLKAVLIERIGEEKFRDLRAQSRLPFR
jgi:hypothetical protein